MKKKADIRKQISVALNEKEFKLLDRLRGIIPRGLYLRAILVEKEKKSNNIIQRIAHLKMKYFEVYKEQPSEIGFSHKNHEEVEQLTFDEVGDLVTRIMTEGANSFSTFSGLKVVSWDAPLMYVSGESGTVTE